jgi:hypothetical protein
VGRFPHDKAVTIMFLAADGMATVQRFSGVNTMTSNTGHEGSARKGWTVSLWVAQILLAALFGSVGVMKLTAPIADLATQMPWTRDVSPNLVRFIGACELAAALGLIVPAVTRVRPLLTPLAAGGLVTVMVLAMAFHFSRGEVQMLPLNFVLGALAAFVAWGRLRKARIGAR